jgi:hypothetical protein
MQRFLQRCLARTPVLGLLMAALVFRALIPTGFMPKHENGTLVMELCSGFGTKSVVVDLGEQESSTSSSQLFDHSPCGFAAAALSAPPPEPPTFPVTASLHSIAVVAGTSPPVAPSPRRAHAPRAPPLI